MSRSGIPAQSTDDPAEARRLVERDGAVVLRGPGPRAGQEWTEYGARRAREVLGDAAVQVVPQFEASTASNERSETARVARLADDPYRARLAVRADEDLWLHNDGYAVGDQAPDRLFLLCERPATRGGANVVIDTAVLLAEIEADDPELHRFLIRTPVDQSEPAFDQVHSPVARFLEDGRLQVRRNPYQRPLPDAPAAHAVLLARWEQRCADAARTAPAVTLAAGDIACIDNYRVLHGRRAYEGTERTAHSIWGWTTSALAVLPRERALIF